MNFFRRDDRRGRRLACRIEVHPPGAREPAPGRPQGRGGLEVLVGIRPENILDVGEGGRGETCTLNVEVDMVEPLGHEVIVHGRIGDDLLVATLDPHRLPKIGTKIDIVLELESLHLFDAATGAAAHRVSGDEEDLHEEDPHGPNDAPVVAGPARRDLLGPTGDRAGADGDRRLARLSRRREDGLREGRRRIQRGQAAAGVKVTTLAVPYDAFADKITAAVPRGKGPDVFIYAQDRLGGWVEAGNTIEPIDFYLDDATKARFLPTTMEAMTYKGQVFGLPLNYKVITMIYNKKLVTTPPKTSGELVKLAQSLTDAAVGEFGLAYWYSNFYYHAPLMNAFGGGVFDASGKPMLNSPANVQSLDLMLKLGESGQDPARRNPRPRSSPRSSTTGKAAIVFSGPVVSRRDREVDRLRPRAAAHDRRGGRQADAPLDDGRGRLHRRTRRKSKEAAYRLREVRDRPPGREDPGRRGAADAREQSVYDDPKVGSATRSSRSSASRSRTRSRCPTRSR